MEFLQIIRSFVIQKGLNMSFVPAPTAMAFHFFTKKYCGKKLKTQTMVVTTESNSVVSKRCKKMGIACHDNIKNKRDFMVEEIKKVRAAGIDGSILFVGNDLNDLDAMLLADYSCTPCDAHPAVKEISTHLFSSAGGAGFVREVVEWIIFR